ncbi:MAG: elongation factor P [Candidatus Omnitrophota bacterium]
MKSATEIRAGNILRLDGKICKVIEQEIRGTGKSGKTVHMKIKGLEDGHILERSIRVEDKVEDLDLQHAKMQFSYRDGDQFVFMNMTTFDQFTLPAKVVGRQEVFLKENTEINVELVEGRPVSIDFPKQVELEVVSAPPAVKGGNDSTYKEVELENGLKILVPQFVKQGERVKINSETLEYVERVTTKSLKTEEFTQPKSDAKP